MFYFQVIECLSSNEKIIFVHYKGFVIEKKSFLTRITLGIWLREIINYQKKYFLYSNFHN
jgi:hypothetical protein